MLRKPWVLIIPVVALLLVQSASLCAMTIAPDPSGVVFDCSGELILGSYIVPADGPITMVTRITALDQMNLNVIDEIVVASFSVSGNAEVPLVSARWTLDRSSFFPVWRLQILGNDNGGQTKVLASLGCGAPLPGHTYEVVSSYHPVLGVVSLRLMDLTTEEIVCATGIEHIQYTGELYPSAFIQLKQAKNPAIAVDRVELYDVYLPIATSVEVVGLDAGKVAMVKFGREDDAAIRILSPGGGTDGAYLVSFENESTHQLLTLEPIYVDREEFLLPLPMDRLVPGLVKMNYEYVVGDHRWLTGATELQIGWINFGFGDIKLGDNRILTNAVRIEGDGRIDSVDLSINAAISHVVYDQSKRTYVKEYEELKTVYKDVLSVTSTPQELVLEIPLSSSELGGLWQVEFTVQADPLVHLRSSGQVRMFYYDPNRTSTFNVPGGNIVNRRDLRIRDPFVLPVKDEGLYYMYGTTGVNPPDRNGFDAYVSLDLETWYGPIPVFRPQRGFWADREFWAPEVFEYKGRYYMFATFNAPDRRRGTQVLVADSPDGPFVPHSDGAITPADFEALDGTLYIDEDGVPWMVFCREWLQVHDGEMWAMPLKEDLSAPAGSAEYLFRASDAPWAHRSSNQVNFVTDGPFLYRTDEGKLLMIWSSGSPWGYAVGIAYSTTGKVTGPWIQDPEPVYKKDGGHGMLFRSFEGELMMAIHSPNTRPNERPLFLPVRVEGLRMNLK